MKHTLFYILAAVMLLSSAALSSCDDDFTHPPVIIPENEEFPEGEGTLDSPYNVAAAIFETKKLENNDKSDFVYVEGIVTKIDEMDTSNFGNATYYISDHPDSETSFEIYRGRGLNGDKFTSTDQLVVGDTVLVYGQMVYFNSKYPEMTQGSKIVRRNGEGASVTPEEPGTPEGEGTAESPFNVAKALEFTKALAAGEVTETEYYVKGIVTRIKDTAISDFGNLSFYIGDKAGASTEFYVFRCMYFNGEKFTSLDQLKVGDEVVVCSKLVNYMGNTPETNQGGKLISINGNTGGGGTTPEEPGTPAGEGTAESPFNVAKALEFTKALAADAATDTEYYVKGIVTSIKSSAASDITSFGNISFYIGDAAGASTTFYVYACFYLNGEKFTSVDQLKVGDEVVVCSKLINYKGNTPETNRGGKLVSINGNTGGGGTTPEEPADALYSFLNENSAECEFTLDNGTLPEGLEYIWSWVEYSGKHYLNATAYVDATKTKYASEGYAISPVIDLSAVTSASCSFEHAAKFQTNLTADCKLVVREEGSKTWTELSIPTWPTAGAWTFANSGDIDLSNYCGKKIEIAFKYLSTAEAADKWEIKNLIIKGNK